MKITLAAIISLIAANPVEKRVQLPISAAQYADLVRYTKYAAAAYNNVCPNPNGQQLVGYFSDAQTDTQGFVAVDNTRKEVVVALRGTSSPNDFYTDSQTALIPCASQGVNYPAGTRCHTGFQTAYNSVADQVINLVRGELARHFVPYSIKVTGHSLGGSLAALAAVSMRSNFPLTNVRAYSYGQPRTGDVNFANYVDSRFPVNPITRDAPFARSIHALDGVPQVIREGSDGTLVTTAGGLIVTQNNPAATTGYRHHSTEFWQTPDPASQQTTKQCQGQEDPTCQDSQFIVAPAFGINPDHLVYYNIPIGNPLIQGQYCS